MGQVDHSQGGSKRRRSKQQHVAICSSMLQQHAAAPPPTGGGGGGGVRVQWDRGKSVGGREGKGEHKNKDNSQVVGAQLLRVTGSILGIVAQRLGLADPTDPDHHLVIRLQGGC